MPKNFDQDIELAKLQTGISGYDAEIIMLVAFFISTGFALLRSASTIAVILLTAPAVLILRDKLCVQRKFKKAFEHIYDGRKIDKDIRYI